MKHSILTLGFIGLMLVGCGSGTNDVQSAESEKVAAGWYMRTVAEANASNGTVYIHNTAGIMGEFEESLDDKDKHDIKAFGTATLSVVFPQGEWEEDSGDYFSDYRQFPGNEERLVWTFQVKNQNSAVDLSKAPLKLSLAGPYDIFSTEENGHVTYEELLSKDTSKKTSIILIDVDNQTEYSYADLQTANLNMDGLKTRTFRWVLGAVDPSDYDEVNTPSAKVSSFSSSIQSAEKSVASDPNDKFGLPPSL